MKKILFVLISALICLHISAQNTDYIRIFNGNDNEKQVSEVEFVSDKGNALNVLSAPPVNDNCANAITLTSNAACTNGTMDQATTETGEYTAAGCASSSPSQTVWYKFTATSSNMYVQLDMTTLVSGATWCPSRFFARIFKTDACQPIASDVVDCDQHGDDGTVVLNSNSLTPGATYLIQLGYNDGNGCKVPNFCIEVGDRVSCGTCSSPCGAACGFTSTPSVVTVTSVCPAYTQRPKIEANETRSQCYTFTANNSTVSFGVIVNTNCGSGGNVSNFTWTLQGSACGSVIQSGTLSNLTMTGLSIGSTYTFCYTFTALNFCYHSIHYPYFVGAQPLPIELINFEANAGIDVVELQWTTATETNNDYFTLERSADGKSFEELTIISGAGNSSFLKEYKYTDQKPLSGINYYRLKQTDFDGKYSYSNIVAAKFEYGTKIKIVPNPAKDQVAMFFDSPVRTMATVSVVDMKGAEMLSEDIRVRMGLNNHLLDISGLNQGVYTVKILINENTLINRLVIK